jgi:renalase
LVFHSSELSKIKVVSNWLPRAFCDIAFSGGVMESKVYDSVVVGAGISGLVLSLRLREMGQSILHLEKSRGLGGRIATRRDNEVTYDHGAQFYKVYKDKPFHLDERWTSEGHVFSWIESQDFYLKCSPGGLTSITKSIADRQSIVFEKKVHLLEQFFDPVSLSPQAKVHLESGEVYFARAVYLTAPVPQCLEIFERSKIEYPAELNQIKYAKALVGLLEVQSDLQQVIDFKYLENVDSEIFSISNQFNKKVSSKLAFTVVMRPAWSEQFFDLNDDKSLDEIIEKFYHFFKNFDPSFQVIRAQLKKWRYSHPLRSYSKKYETLGQDRNIFILGDAFGGGSIRGAIESADSVEPLLKS